MSANNRSLASPILRDLDKKFVFLSGPRQVGKTTLAKKLIRSLGGKYYLYDDADDRALILEKKFLADHVVCLDELHKFPRWKNLIKGVYDKYHEHLKLILTGSARLDVYQKSGDSLFGRYYLHHLHPFTLGELQSKNLAGPPSDPHIFGESEGNLRDLLRFGGFPEPLFTASDTEHRRWRNLRRQLLVREELREITQVKLLGLIEQLMILLPGRIGSLFSYRSLAENIQVSPPTVAAWMKLFERLFFVFGVTPYAKNITRSLLKQPKYYLYDWSEIPDEGARFENLIAGHLWKSVQIWTDLGYGDFALHYVRDRDGREVDFLITRANRPWCLIESKLAETAPTPALEFFSRRLQCQAIQLVLKRGVAHRAGNTLVVSAGRWLLGWL